MNAPDAVVVSGDAVVIEELERELGERFRTRRLRVSHAFHSPLMDPMLDEFRVVAEQLTYHAPSIPIVSTVTGVEDPDLATAGYWVNQVRATVRFADAITTAVGGDVSPVVLELGRMRCSRRWSSPPSTAFRCMRRGVVAVMRRPRCSALWPVCTPPGSASTGPVCCRGAVGWICRRMRSSTSVSG